MSEKVAFITGITADGAYLADFLLGRGYIVHGVKRRSSLLNTERIDYLYRDRHDAAARLFLHYGDMTDPSTLRLLGEEAPRARSRGRRHEEGRQDRLYLGISTARLGPLLATCRGEVAAAR